MTDVVELVAKAIQDEMRRQGVLFEWDGEEDLSRLAMNAGEYADLGLVCRAAINAVVRELTTVNGPLWRDIDDEIGRSARSYAIGVKSGLSASMNSSLDYTSMQILAFIRRHAGVPEQP